MYKTNQVAGGTHRPGDLASGSWIPLMKIAPSESNLKRFSMFWGGERWVGDFWPVEIALAGILLQRIASLCKESS